MNNRRNLLVNNKSNEEFVDLGLPSGLKWAKGNLKKSGNTCVIGEETDYGDFWSWANVGLTNDTGWMSSTGGKMTQIMYNSTIGKKLSVNIPVTPTLDVACKYLGTPWRLPTKAEFDELINNTDKEWTSINGINGYKFMKKSNHSVYIFFPASGYCYDNGLTGRGSDGFYWSSTYFNSMYSYYLRFNSSQVNGSTYDRYYGFSVRPVSD